MQLHRKIDISLSIARILPSKMVKKYNKTKVEYPKQSYSRESLFIASEAAGDSVTLGKTYKAAAAARLFNPSLFSKQLSALVFKKISFFVKRLQKKKKRSSITLWIFMRVCFLFSIQAVRRALRLCRPETEKSDYRVVQLQVLRI